MAVNHPQFGTFCEICFAPLTRERCAVDTDGTRWDVCTGECAVQAGIPEAPVQAVEQDWLIPYTLTDPAIPADHPFVAPTLEDLRGLDRCAWARSTTDATSVCWRPRADHPHAAPGVTR